MRKLFILIAVIFAQAALLGVLLPKVFAANSTIVHANCLQITVKFNAPAAWMKSSSNRSIQIGCDGQSNFTGSHSCEGGILTIKPGQKEATLGNCSCFGTQGCLKVGKTLQRTEDKKAKRWNVTVVKKLSDTTDIKSGKCSVNYFDRSNNKKIKLPSICGTNKQRFSIGININCHAPSVSPTPGQCVGPAPVANVTVSCPTCNASGLTPTPTPLPPTPTPQPPTVTPTPTITPTPTPGGNL